MLNLGEDDVASWLACLLLLIYHLSFWSQFLPDRSLSHKSPPLCYYLYPSSTLFCSPTLPSSPSHQHPTTVVLPFLVSYNNTSHLTCLKRTTQTIFTSPSFFPDPKSFFFVCQEERRKKTLLFTV